MTISTLITQLSILLSSFSSFISSIRDVLIIVILILGIRYISLVVKDLPEIIDKFYERREQHLRKKSAMGYK